MACCESASGLVKGAAGEYFIRASGSEARARAPPGQSASVGPLLAAFDVHLRPPADSI